MSPDNNTKQIAAAVQSFLEKATGHKIKNRAADLVKTGIVNSLTMFRLIDFIEKKFKVKVDILSLNPDNFNSLQSISEQIKLWMSK